MGGKAQARRPARARPGRPAPANRGRLVTLVLGGVVAFAIVLLVGVVVGGPILDGLHPVVTVDGTTITRSDLRARLEIDEALRGARRAAIRSLLGAGFIDPADADRLNLMLESEAADALGVAIDGLVFDQLIVDEAGARGLAADTDREAEGQRALARWLDRQIQAVVLELPLGSETRTDEAWPAPPAAFADRVAVEAAFKLAIEQAHAVLDAGSSPADIASSLRAAGWRARVEDRWIPSAGPVDELPDALVADARDEPTAGRTLTPVVDLATARAAAGRVARLGADAPWAALPGPDLDSVDTDRWARARAAERVLRAGMHRLADAPDLLLLRVTEVVVGPTAMEGIEGDFRSFAHLVVDRLPTSGGTASAETARWLADELRALPAPDRAARFEALVGDANRDAPADPLAMSGDIGYLTRDQLIPELGALAFADGVAPGDILGPVTTTAGTELFLVRDRFKGVLDERASAALVEARTAPDLLALARRIGPAGAWLRADGSLWRADLEVPDGSPMAAAYHLPIGQQSGAVALDGDLLVVRVEERRAGAAPPDVRARLAARAFERWLGARLANAAVQRDAEPLPGILVEAEPSAPNAETPSLGPLAPTPYLPSR